jgi:hypothetical protein
VRILTIVRVIWKKKIRSFARKCFENYRREVAPFISKDVKNSYIPYHKTTPSAHSVAQVFFQLKMHTTTLKQYIYKAVVQKNKRYRDQNDDVKRSRRAWRNSARLEVVRLRG